MAGSETEEKEKRKKKREKRKRLRDFHLTFFFLLFSFFFCLAPGINSYIAAGENFIRVGNFIILGDTLVKPGVPVEGV